MSQKLKTAAAIKAPSAAVSSKSDKIAEFIYEKFLKRLYAFRSRREQNSVNYSMTNTLLLMFFPLFIVLIAEVNQMKYVDNLIIFMSERPSIILFDVICAGAIFAVLLLLFKKAWFAVFLQTIVYLTLSTVELFKYGANGNHLILTDMKMATNVKSLTSFAYIKITPMLITYISLGLLYFAVVYWFNPQIKMKKLPRYVISGVVTAVCAVILLVPSVSKAVFSAFDVDDKASTNAFVTNEKFANNSFLAFIVQTTAENLANQLEEPEEYNEETIGSILEDNETDDTTSDFDKPNVIMIMSEAFADFRVVDDSIETDAYDYFDRICEESLTGTTIVPTFGAYTVRTEFELLFGLPVKSLNDVAMPQRVLLERAQTTVPRYYSELGYDTYYIHTFLSSFYTRSRVYSYFGFDEMIFQDDFDVDVNYRYSYIEDKVIFDEIEYLLDESDEPVYIHTTTMQNHQPYNQGEDPTDELGNYLAGIGDMTEDLYYFLENLKELDEPTVVFFVGDHFPSFRGEGNIYDELGYNSSNCETLFEQTFFIWSNYEVENPALPEQTLSAFYMPYVVMDVIGTPTDDFIDTMCGFMDESPIYSTQYDNTTPINEELDLLTYDRILGDAISYGKELPIVTEEEKYGYTPEDEEE
ncbi:MAG: LTA synthase family protein [Oscillospiraceae bacterium]|nr:LTA synthase family protein [Oscillospiraceae bacterium]